MQRGVSCVIVEHKVEKGMTETQKRNEIIKQTPHNFTIVETHERSEDCKQTKPGLLAIDSLWESYFIA